METLFPLGENWDWMTFFLYVAVGSVSSWLFRNGARTRAFYRKERRLNLYYFFAWLLLTLLAGLRSSAVGPDTATYVAAFQLINVSEYSLSEVVRNSRWEPGFMAYLYAVRIFTKSETALLTITYGIVAYGYVRLIAEFYEEKSDYIFLQIFIFYYVNNMSAMRSALACVFFFLSFIALCNEKTLKSVLLTLVSCMFHYSMMYHLYIIFAVTLLKSCRFSENRRWWLGAACVSTVASFLCLRMVRALLANTKYRSYAMIALKDRSLWGSVFVIVYAILAVRCMKEKELLRPDSLRRLLRATLCFMVSYPMVYMIGAYRLTYYYALPRLAVWSHLSNIYCEKWSAQREWLFRYAERTGVVLYLLFLLSRFSGSGNFAYRLYRQGPESESIKWAFQ